MSKCIIAGGRDYMWSRSDTQFLDLVHKSTPITAVVCGMASGADNMGYQWAKFNDIEVIEKPALWDDLTAVPCKIKYNKKGEPFNCLAGFNRNEEMAKIADVCILFPGGRGTADMKERAQKHGLTIIEYYP